MSFDPETRDDRDRTALMLALRRADDDFLHSLIERGVDINAADRSGNTALHLAARSARQGEHPRQVEWLLEQGADPSTANNRGQTPAEVAADRNRDDAAEMLRQAASAANGDG